MINLLKKYLHKNGYNDQKETFEDLFQSHPNYPSVFAITDTLDVLSIENIAIKVPKEQFIDLPESFLAIYKGDIVITSKKHNSVVIETQDAKLKKLTINEFLSNWNEVIIAIEPNIKTTLNKEKTNTKWLLYILPCIALIGISITYNKYDLNAIILLITSIIGLILSVFIVQEKFGVKNEIASKFCNINPNTSCDSVIKSKKSEINKQIDFSDLPLLFFSISVTSILIQPESSIKIVGLISLLAIPAIVYSVWLQKFEIKKWCILCLAISFIIILQSLIFTMGDNIVFNYSITIFNSFIFSSILISLIWFSAKPVLENKIKFEKETNELMRFKRNFDLFQFLSKNIEEYDDFENLKGISFGNENASMQLSLILSPSCGHCHTAFKEAYELHQKFPEKVHLNVLFNLNPENNNNSYKIIAETLLALNEQDPKKAKEALIDWHINQLDLKKWTTKWTIESPHLIVNKQLKNQYYWCLKNDYNFTPVKIVNNKLFPEEYNINELKYFINNFYEETILGNQIETA